MPAKLHRKFLTQKRLQKFDLQAKSFQATLAILEFNVKLQNFSKLSRLQMQNLKF